MKSQITLPDELRTDTLQDIVIGKSVYTPPWAMKVDVDNSVWLDTSYTYSLNVFGTSALKVKKTSYGWEVDVSSCNQYRWERELLNCNSSRIEKVISIVGYQKSTNDPNSYSQEVTWPKEL